MTYLTGLAEIKTPQVFISSYKNPLSIAWVRTMETQQEDSVLVEVRRTGYAISNYKEKELFSKDWVYEVRVETGV